MEQARYWMWAKTRKPDSNPHNILSPMNSYCDSWEEQVFAEDAAGTLGGCVWPPRSYSCSFCRREFRSAQALGGHMNVHRRDKARLKQSPIPSTEVVPQNHALNTCRSQICTISYNNPNPEFSDTRVSFPPATKVINIEEKMTTLCFLPPLVHKNDVVSLNPHSWSSFVAEKRDRVLSSNKNEEKKFKAIVEQESRAEKEDCVTEDFPVSLNFVVCRTRTNKSSNEEVASCKRRKIEEKPSSFFPQMSAFDRCVAQSEFLKFGPGPAEEPDLELRIGNAPKVKLKTVISTKDLMHHFT